MQSSTETGWADGAARAARRFEDRNPTSGMYTFRHFPNVNESRIREMIEEKLDDSKPYFATYDRPQAVAMIDHRTPFSQWYLGRHADPVPTAYERDAGILPKRVYL